MDVRPDTSNWIGPGDSRPGVAVMPAIYNRPRAHRDGSLRHWACVCVAGRDTDASPSNTLIYLRLCDRAAIDGRPADVLAAAEEPAARDYLGLRTSPSLRIARRKAQRPAARIPRNIPIFLYRARIQRR